MRLYLLLFLTTACFSQQDQTLGQDPEFFLLPYRVADKWGLADTLGQVKVKPQYDEFEKIIYINAFEKKSLYAFRKDGKLTIVDHLNTPQEPARHENASSDAPWIENPEPAKSTSRSAWEAEKTNKQRYYLGELTRGVSQEDLDKIAPYSITRYNHHLKYTQDGKVGIGRFGHTPQAGSPRKITITPFVQPLYDDADEIGDSRYLVKLKGKYGIESHYPSLRLEPVYDQIAFFPGSGNTLVVRKGKKYAVHYRGQFISGFEFDDIAIVPSPTGESTSLFYLVFTKSGKKSIERYGQSIPVPEFDQITVSSEKKILTNGRVVFSDVVQVRKDGKYGILRFNPLPEIAVPVAYDRLAKDPNSDLFFTTIGKWNGMYGYQGVVNIPSQYQSVVFLTAVSRPGAQDVYYFQAITKEGKKIVLDQKGREFYAE